MGACYGKRKNLPSIVILNSQAQEKLSTAKGRNEITLFSLKSCGNEIISDCNCPKNSVAEESFKKVEALYTTEKNVSL